MQERTPITVHIPEDVVKRAIENVTENHRNGIYQSNPETQRLLGAVERSTKLDYRDYSLIVY